MCSVGIHTLGHTGKSNNYGLCCAYIKARGYQPLLVGTQTADIIFLKRTAPTSSAGSELHLHSLPLESFETSMGYLINDCYVLQTPKYYKTRED